MNIGIQHASAEILLWAGAHSTYDKNYIAHSVSLLEDKKAASVGGIIVPIGTTITGKAIAIAASNPFGVGNAKYRYTNQEGWVDTVFAGCFRKKDILKIGGFNEKWQVNQDGELNYRLRDMIGKIYLSPKIRSHYYVRDSYTKLAKQYYHYGIGRSKTLIRHPKSITPRQVVAPVFVVVLFASLIYSVTSLVPFLLLLLVHSGVGFFYIGKNRKSELRFATKIRVYIAFLTMHITWGMGFLVGMIKQLARLVLSKFSKT